MTRMSVAAVVSRWVAWLRREKPVVPFEVPLQDVIWGLGSFCVLHHRAFDPALLLRELPTPPLTTDALITAARSLQFRIRRRDVSRAAMVKLPMPCLAVLRDDSPASSPSGRLALIVKVDEKQVMLFRAGTNQGV